MKKHLQTILAIAFIGSTLTLQAQDKKEGKITIEITKEINGEKKTFKGEYENEAQMKADPNYQEFAGEDDGINVWFGGTDGNSEEIRLHLDRLKDHSKKMLSFSFGDSSNAFFKHKDADDHAISMFFKHLDGDSSGVFHFRGSDEEHQERMMDLRIELESLMDGFNEENSSHVYVFSSKKVKVVEVEGDEFGKKGEVSKSSRLELDDLKFFPNPSTNGRFNVRFRVPEEKELSIKVFNLEGKEVYNRYFERFGGTYSELIDLSGQSEGIYLLEISQGGKRLTKKIMINK